MALARSLGVADGGLAAKSDRLDIFLTLDDATGPLDAAFFDDVQGPYASTVFDSWLLLVRGELRRTGPRGVSLRATGAWDLGHVHEEWSTGGLDAGPLDAAAPVDAADEIFDEVFRMRHHAEHVEPVGIDAGNVVQRAIRIGCAANFAIRIAIAEGDAIVAFEAFQRLVIGDIIAFAMGDRDLDGLTFLVSGGEGCVGAADFEMLHLADEFETGIAHQHARQQSR